MRVLLLLLSVLCACAPSDRMSNEEAQAWIDNIRVSEPWPAGGVAPDFALPVIDVTGLTTDSARLADMNGQVVVLNFGATWCRPCIAEHDSFARLAAKFAADSVVFLGIVGLDTPERIAEFDRENPTGYPNLFDSSEQVSKLYRTPGVPHHVVIDRRGRIVFSAPGGPIAENAFAMVIERALIGQVDSLVDDYVDAAMRERTRGG